ncbi:hypothetical protein [Steroidobacter sp.]|uniref:hypothetical protein n=1 Tax=Steroidobacter sp. TaxID=1978227 RepID=UPI001A558636|nr:hypothetical protein [Steroidobacter sp.]MBL8269487.1 hypothetical protein [Steroidobacter sp.]
MSTVEISALERFILWSFRIGLAPSDPALTHRLLHRAFHSVRIGAALPHFIRITTHVSRMWHTMQRAPDIHCTCCNVIGHDEWRLLQMLAALQARDVSQAMRHLDVVLPAGGSRRVLPAAMHVAASLSSAGWVLHPINLQIANQPLPSPAALSLH